MQQYVIEAKKSLFEIQLLGWKPRVYRDICLKLKLYKIPKVRSIIRNYYFIKVRVVRNNHDQANGYCR